MLFPLPLNLCAYNWIIYDRLWFCAGWIPFFEKTDTKECLCESQISCGVTAEVSDALTTRSNCITSATLSHSCEYNIWLWWYLWDGETKMEVYAALDQAALMSCHDCESLVLRIWGPRKKKENERPLSHWWEAERWLSSLYAYFTETVTWNSGWKPENCWEILWESGLKYLAWCKYSRPKFN